MFCSFLLFSPLRGSVKCGVGKGRRIWRANVLRLIRYPFRDAEFCKKLHQHVNPDLLQAWIADPGYKDAIRFAPAPNSRGSGDRRLTRSTARTTGVAPAWGEDVTWGEPWESAWGLE